MVVEDWPSVGSTNEVDVAVNEVAELVGYSAFPANGVSMAFYLHAFRDGKDIELYLPPSGILAQYGTAASTPARHMIAGPAKIRLWTTQRGPGGTYCTWKITPESFPPDKTIVIPQAGGANIGMECSTNLIDWVPASLGVYTNVPATKFFRLKAERLP